MPSILSRTIAAVLTTALLAGPAHAGGTIWFTELWLGVGNSKVRQATLDGTFVTDAITGLDYPVGLAVDEPNGFVYLANPDGYANQVLRSNIDGSGMTILSDDVAWPRGIAVDATHAYVTGTWIMSIPIGGGPHTILAAGVFGGAGIAIDATNIYWAESQADVIRTMPKTGGSPTILATPTAPEGLAITPTHIYFGAGDKIQRVPIGGGTVSDVISSGVHASFLTIDAVNSLLYWTDASGSLHRANLDGTAPTTLASRLYQVGGLALMSDPSIEGVADKCVAAKLLAIGKREAGLLKCQAKVVSQGNGGLFAPCIAKVDEKFQRAFAEAGDCAGEEAACTQLGDYCLGAVNYDLPGYEDKCVAVRLKAAARKSMALLKCAAAAAEVGEAIDVAPGGCTERAELAFQKTYGKVSGCAGDGESVDVSRSINLRCASDLVELDRSINVVGICPE